MALAWLLLWIALDWRDEQQVQLFFVLAALPASMAASGGTQCGCRAL